MDELIIFMFGLLKWEVSTAVHGKDAIVLSDGRVLKWVGWDMVANPPVPGGLFVVHKYDPSAISLSEIARLENGEIAYEHIDPKQALVAEMGTH